MELLPYLYALLVFAIVAFLFILLGRIFLNVETTFEYNFHRVIKEDTEGNKYDQELVKIIEVKGKEGWKFERLLDMKQIGHGSTVQMIIFSKSKNKIKLF